MPTAECSPNSANPDGALMDGGASGAHSAIRGQTGIIDEVCAKGGAVLWEVDRIDLRHEYSVSLHPTVRSFHDRRSL